MVSGVRQLLVMRDGLVLIERPTTHNAAKLRRTYPTFSMGISQTSSSIAPPPVAPSGRRIRAGLGPKLYMPAFASQGGYSAAAHLNFGSGHGRRAYGRQEPFEHCGPSRRLVPTAGD